MIVLFAFLMWCAMIVLVVVLNVDWTDEQRHTESHSVSQDFEEFYCDLCLSTGCDFKQSEAVKLYRVFCKREQDQQVEA